MSGKTDYWGLGLVKTLWFRWLELLLAFGVLPLVLGLFCPPTTWIFVLWGLALAALWKLKRDRAEATAQPIMKVRWADVWPIILRFAAVGVVLLGAVWFWLPDHFFALPRQRPGAWAAIMVLYPLWSVYPQELLFRKWFFQRYTLVFGDGKWLVLASALFFGWAHVVMQNWLAILLSMAGGTLFALTYRRTKSLALACFEHALYGDLIFTIGLGSFFFHGSLGRV